MSALDSWIVLVSVLSTLFSASCLAWALLHLPWLRWLVAAYLTFLAIYLYFVGRKYRRMWP